ncbi:MAG: hypothetical protein J0H15_09795 [Xanthomonadales bacterium]|nr:hypothetical protein [Xanthomonadales bacterium]
MKLAAFEAVAKVLDTAQVRYLVAGGLAVVAHGHVRLTLDIDLVVALDPNNTHRAFKALADIGYRPSVPVDAGSFAQAEQRQRWRDEKNMQVLSFFSDDFPGTAVDVFVYEPFDFAREYEIALQGELLPGLVARFVSIPTLIQMKRAAGRAKDLDDIQHLEWLQEDASR